MHQFDDVCINLIRSLELFHRSARICEEMEDKEPQALGAVDIQVLDRGMSENRSDQQAKPPERPPLFNALRRGTWRFSPYPLPDAALLAPDWVKEPLSRSLQGGLPSWSAAKSVSRRDRNPNVHRP